jgi:hypothetical protein
MISGRAFDGRNGELCVDPSSDPASDDSAEARLVKFEDMGGRVGNKNGIVEGNKIEGFSVCS